MHLLVHLTLLCSFFLSCFIYSFITLSFFYSLIVSFFPVFSCKFFHSFIQSFIIFHSFFLSFLISINYENASTSSGKNANYTSPLCVCQRDIERVFLFLTDCWNSTFLLGAVFYQSAQRNSLSKQTD